jgi:hypothetical protein
LVEYGLPMPELVPVETAAGILAERRLHAPAPWAWCPSAAAAFQPLRPLFAVVPPPTATALFSKATAAGLLARLADMGIDTGPLPVRAESAAEAVAAGQAFGSAGWSELLAKPIFGMAGRGHRRFLPGASPVAGDMACVIEPWLPKVFEFSAHYDVQGKELRHLGFVRMETDKAGRWVSSATGQKFLKGLAPELAAFLTRVMPAYENQLKSALQELLQEHPHNGPLGIDAFVWRDTSGALRLRPVVEINPRWTMGRLALTLQRRHAPNRWLKLHALPAAAATNLAPPVCSNGRIESGTVSLTDPTQAAHHAIAISISQGP